MKPAFDRHNVPVVFATDDNYAPYLYTALDSLLNNFSCAHHADIIILVGKPSSTTIQEAFSDLAAAHPQASIRFLNIPVDTVRLIDRMSIDPRYGAATCYRLFLPDILSDYKRVIYCDVDVVIPGDLSELYLTEMGELCLGACENVPSLLPIDKEFSRYITGTLGVLPRNYFNAGVLLMDLNRMRSMNWNEQILRQLHHIQNYRFPDQDVLNVVCANAWFRLDYKWNFQQAILSEHENNIFQMYARNKEWKVVHFSSVKPWSLKPLLDRNEAYFEWETYALRNPLLNWKPQLEALHAFLPLLQRRMIFRAINRFLPPSATRFGYYRRKRSQYLGMKRDAQRLDRHLSLVKTHLSSPAPFVATRNHTSNAPIHGQTRQAVQEFLALLDCIRHPLRFIPRLPQRAFHLLSRWIAWRQAPSSFPKYLCVAACLKNEAAYIEEWLEYHLLMGVEHFYLYDNESGDHLSEKLQPYILQGLVTLTTWKGKGQQRAIYRHALRTCRATARWLAFIDIDEFLQPLQHPDLPSFLREREYARQIVAHWVHFGSSGRQSYDPGLVIERFTFREGGSLHVGKSFVQPAAAIDTLIHFCLVFGKSVDEDGNPQESFQPAKSACTIIRVNHYAVKSREEFLAKAAKGRASTGGPKADGYFDRLDRNEIEDRSMAAYAAAVRDRILLRRSGAKAG